MIFTFISPFINLFKDRNISIDVVFFSSLLILLPIALITGPAIPDIFLSLIALFFLVKSFLDKLWIYYKNPIFLGFISFCIYSVFRSLFSDMPIESLTTGGSMFYFRYIFFALGVWYLLDNNPYLSKCLLIISTLCLIVVCLDGIFQYFMGINFFGNEKYSSFRLTGLFGDEPILGRYTSYMFIFTFALINQNVNNYVLRNNLSIFLYSICFITVFLSGERAALLYMIMFSLLIIIFSDQFRLKLIKGTLVIVALISVISIFQPTAKNRMIDTTINDLAENKLKFLTYNKGYEDHFLSALKLFKDYPLFGVAANTYRYQCTKQESNNLASGCNSHPHNIYLQVLAELGIIGFLFIFSFFIYLFLIGLKHLLSMLSLNYGNKLPFKDLLYPMVLFIFWWPLIPHMNFYNNWINVIIMLPLGYFMRNFFGSIKE